ncbi:histidinol-phosphate transaminase [bacterium]|nr:histidinol-phosphate transaminase [bacterium]
MKKQSILEHVKPEVRSISAYTLKEYESDIKINQNENPYDVPEKLKRELLDFALERSWSRYPPFDPAGLREKLASYAGWKPDGVLVGNGSNEIIQAVLTVMLRPGAKLVLPSPTFTVYKLIGTVLGADVRQVPLKQDFTYDCDALEREFLNGGDMIIICSPNNPTGCLYPLERLTALLEQTDAPVVIDEAYFEFSGVTAVNLLEKYDNLIVLRTFSKAFSLAGLRVGYGLMNPDLAQEVNKAKLPYNINFFSVAAAIKLLENRDELAASVKILIGERDRMIPALNKIDGVTAYPSRANFILVETPFEPRKVFDGLLKDGLLVRDVSSYPMLGRAFRVSVSRYEDNERFIVSLRQVINRLKKSPDRL